MSKQDLPTGSPQSPVQESGELRALRAARKLQMELEELRASLREPIAIVGMGSRLPFESQGLTPWEGLSQGVDASREIPRDRWDPDAADTADSAGSAIKRGNFLADVARFDASFFGIAPVEASVMDPQQRLVLEMAWEALSDAGLSLPAVRSVRSGVFLGVCQYDYDEIAASATRTEGFGAYVATGTSPSVIAGRVSYALGLTGPSFVVDTACSSSLVAVHLACESLRSRTSDIALAGGVNLMLSARTTTKLERLGMLSADGRCRTFDATGKGYGRGEGCVVIVLKRLSDAVRDGDRVLAVVRGSAVNQDGHSDGLTAPSGLAQQQVIRTALEFGRVSPGDVQYIEAHGTGTVLGDPIEVDALSEVFASSHSKTSPLAIGSIKTNVGHLEGAAGISGLIKTVLAIKHRQLPPSLHCHAPNPHIPWEHLPFRVQTELGAWPEPSKPLIAGVSSFGFSGTNAHVVLSEPPVVKSAEASAEPAHASAPPVTLPLCISAKTSTALRDYAASFATHLASPLDAPLTWRDVAFTSSTRRDHHDHRMVVIGTSAADWSEKLAAFAKGEIGPRVVTGDATVPASRAVFVFSGQGTQWWGMGRDLLQHEAVFRSTLEECGEHIRKEADWSLIEELSRDEATTRLHRTDIAQPALVSLQMALVHLLASWGVAPAAVVGHSVGEIAAAFAAGVLTLEQACRLATVRGRVMHKASGHGKMAAVRLTAEEAEQIARTFPVQPPPEPKTPPAPQPHLVHLSGAKVGRSQRITSDDVTIGRAPESTIRIKEAGVSRTHARIVGREDGTYEIIDTESSNGTFVNGQRISEPTKLAKGDEIRFGKTMAVQWMFIGELERLYDNDDEPSSTGWMADAPTQVVIGAYNGPQSVVLSGAPDAIKRALEMVGSQGAETRELQVDYAFHSPQMDRFMDELGAALKLLVPAAPQIPIVSTLTGTTGGSFDAAYWVRQMREPVKFAQATQVLLDQGYDLFVEVGPHPALLASIDETAAQSMKRARLLATLRRKENQTQCMQECLGTLHCVGHSADWAKVFTVRGRVVPLPSYPWQRERYWVPAGKQGRSRTGASKWALVHTQLSSSDRAGKHVFEVELDLEDDAYAYLSDHKVQGLVWLPGAAFLEMALEAGQAAFDGRVVSVADVRLTQPLTLSKGESVVVQLVMSPEQGGASQFRISSRLSKERTAAWTEHANGRVVVDASNTLSRPRLADVQNRCRREMAASDLYDELTRMGLPYGPAFQGIERAWAGTGEALSKLVPLEKLTDQVQGYLVHPTLLDAAFQTVLVAAHGQLGGRTYVPSTIKSLRVLGGGTPRWAHLSLRSSSEESLVCDLTLLDENDQGVAEVEGLLVVGLGSARDKLDEWLFETVWRASERKAPEAIAGRWLLLSDAQGVGSGLRRWLEERGAEVVTVRCGSAFQQQDETHYELNPDDATALARLLKDSCGKSVPRGVVHLWSLDSRSGENAGDAVAARRAEVLSCTSLLHTVQAFEQSGWIERPRLFVVTRGSQAAKGSADVKYPEQALAWGFGASVAHEMPELRTTLIDLDPEGGSELLGAEVVQADEENRVTLRGTERLVPRLARHVRAKKASGVVRSLTVSSKEGYRLDAIEPGRMDSLTLQPMPVLQPGPGEVLIRTRASGVNFRDVLMALGMYPGLGAGRQPMGGECSGIVHAVGTGVDRLQVGDEVVAISVNGFDSHVLVREDLVVKKPASLTFEQAASMPSVATTVLYSLDRVARLQKGERILVHAATGGVGLTAVQYAKHVGAEIYATAGSEEKRAYLRSLGIAHVYDSRTLNWADDVMRDTEGVGVDVVLNSLAGEALLKGVSVLAPFGRFVELGKRDIYENNALGLYALRNNVTVSAVALDQMAQERPKESRLLLEETFRLLGSGVLSPLPVESFPATRALDAFEHLSRARHIGKVVLRAEETVTVRDSERSEAIDPTRTYLVTGGLGGLGLVVAKRLAKLGAEHLALLGRRGPTATAQKEISELESSGVTVYVLQGDVGNVSSLTDALAKLAGTAPPVGGVVHAAGVLDDATLASLTAERIGSVLSPKVAGALALDALLPDISLRVYFSSVAGLLGSAGQAHYAAANAFLDALAHHVSSRGEPALSLDWGAWGEVGLAARTDRVDNVSRQGLALLRPEEGAELFERLLSTSASQLAPVPIDFRQWRQANPQVAGMPFLREVLSSSAQRSSQKNAGLFDRLSTALSDSDRLVIVEDYVRATIAGILHAPPVSLTRTASLKQLGFDSLMMVSLKNTLERDFAIPMSTGTLFAHPTVEKLALHLAGKLAPPSAPAAAEAPAHETVVAIENVGEAPGADIAELDDAEVSALLATTLQRLQVSGDNDGDA